MVLEVDINSKLLAESDDRLLERLKESDSEAFTAIYMKYHPLLFTFAMRYLKNKCDVEDILQTVFVKLWTARDVVLGITDLRWYLFSMTKNMAINYIRNSNNALQHNYKIVQQQPDADDDLYTYADRKHMTDILQIAIQQLPPQQRTVAQLRCEGYSNKEIASRLHLSINTVNTHYQIGLRTLRRYLDGIVKILVFYCLIFS